LQQAASIAAATAVALIYSGHRAAICIHIQPPHRLQQAACIAAATAVALIYRGHRADI
jgi:hypothetical protein